MSSLPLFDERPPFDRSRLAARLRQLASERIYIGTSSWKYPGWMDQIYTRDRYLARGCFSERTFQAECLREYAETFPSVCGDFTFYQFPSEDYWRRLFASAPPGLKFAFKVPEDITAKVFPKHPRYGARQGVVNSSFLDPILLQEAFLRPLGQYRDRINALIFEFGTFSKRSYPGLREFLADLDRFLSEIPPGFPYSVEIRNAEFLEPEYFHCLREHRVAHVINSWTRMPEIRAQLRVPDVFTADFTVSRALLRPGRAYEDAVKAFSPYEETRDPYPEGREGLRELIESARANRVSAFIYVNNRFEGSAPRTIEAIVE